MSHFLYRIGWWRFQARFFGAINRRLERWHERLHPEFVDRCLSCADRREIEEDKAAIAADFAYVWSAPSTAFTSLDDIR